MHTCTHTLTFAPSPAPQLTLDGAEDIPDFDEASLRQDLEQARVEKLRSSLSTPYFSIFCKHQLNAQNLAKSISMRLPVESEYIDMNPPGIIAFSDGNIIEFNGLGTPMSIRRAVMDDHIEKTLPIPLPQQLAKEIVPVLVPDLVTCDDAELDAFADRYIPNCSQRQKSAWRETVEYLRRVFRYSDDDNGLMTIMTQVAKSFVGRMEDGNCLVFLGAEIDNPDGSVSFSQGNGKTYVIKIVTDVLEGLVGQADPGDIFFNEKRDPNGQTPRF